MDRARAAPAGAGRERVVGPYLLRDVRPGDERRLAGLFRACFGVNPSLFEPRTAELWRAKYSVGGPPRSCLAEHRDSGAVVAHVGGLALTMRCRGERRSTVQCTDHMVDPEHRDKLAGASLFAQLMRLWIDNHCGADRAFLAWGFPSRRNHRIGARLLGYSTLAPVVVLVRPVEPNPGDLAVASGTVEGLPRDAGELWERTREPAEFVVERDQRYFEKRYAGQRGERYRVVSIPGRALAVVREPALERGVALILDWIVARDDRAGAAALLDAVDCAALDLGCDRIAVWLPRGDRAWSWFLEHGSVEHGSVEHGSVEHGSTERRVSLLRSGRSWRKELPIEAIDAGLAFALGDIDFL